MKIPFILSRAFFLAIIVIISSCEKKQDISAMLTQAVRSCEESGCFPFMHLPSPEDVANVRNPRKHIVLASNLQKVKPDVFRREFDLLDCVEFKNLPVSLDNIEKEHVFRERRITVIDVDTMNVPRFMEHMERKGAYGPLFIINPIRFRCSEEDYIFTGFIWHKRRFLYQFSEDGSLTAHRSFTPL